MTDAAASAQSSPEISPAKMRLVVAASALGTVFEWYDFFVYAALASVISPIFFAGLPDAQAFVFTLLTFGVGFVVRPLGALVFGKIGDSVGRKGAFLMTVTIMGIATFAIGLLPSAAQAGVLAPALLVTCRVLQGFALGGEYGGAAIYVAEHANPKRRGASTGWIQTSAAFGLGGALLVVLITRAWLGEDALKAWGWRVPFLLSVGLLIVSVWIRLQLHESPAFKKLQDEGRVSKAAYHESFMQWRNLKVVLLAFFTVCTAQGVVWYTGFFYTQFYLDRILKIDSQTVNVLMIAAVALSAPLYIFFAWLSDKIGRKIVMLSGIVLMLLLGNQQIESVSAIGQTTTQIKATRAAFEGRLRTALNAAGYPAHAPGAMQGWSWSEIVRVFNEKIGVFLMMALFVIAATALYGPQAAALVELFPTRIRYTALSVPYHIGVGWLGGLLPAIVFAINTATGSLYAGLWFPVIFTALAAVVTFFFLPETKDRDIHAD